MASVHVKEGAEFEEEDRVQHANNRFNNPAPGIVSNLLTLKLAAYSHVLPIFREVVCTIQQNFPNNMRDTFQEVVPPALIAVLRENLPAFNSTMLEQCQNIHNKSNNFLLSKLSGYYEGMSSDMNVLRLQLKDSTSIQQRIERGILGVKFRSNENIPEAVPRNLDLQLTNSFEKCVPQSSDSADAGAHYESLKEV